MTKEEKLQILSEGMEINERLSSLMDSIGDDMEVHDMVMAVLKPSMNKLTNKTVKGMTNRMPALSSILKDLSK